MIDKMETIFKGHSDYLYCIIARSSNNQTKTGSEDRTAWIWNFLMKLLGIKMQVMDMDDVLRPLIYNWNG